MAPKPSRAWPIAASKSVAHGRRPYRACIAPQAATEPGTETLSGPLAGMPRAYRSGVAARGAGPVPLKTTASPVRRA